MSNMEAKQLKEAYNKAKSLAESRGYDVVIHEATLSDDAVIYLVSFGKGKYIGCAGAPVYILITPQQEAKFISFSEYCDLIG